MRRKQEIKKIGKPQIARSNDFHPKKKSHKKAEIKEKQEEITRVKTQ